MVVATPGVVSKFPAHADIMGSAGSPTLNLCGP